MSENTIEMQFKLEGIPCMLRISDKAKFKSYLGGLNKPNPEGIPIAKINNLGKKQVKVKLAIYNGNIEAEKSEKEGISL